MEVRKGSGQGSGAQDYQAFFSNCLYTDAEIIPVNKIKSDIFIIYLKIKLSRP
jgi:hypothetical protein